MSNTKTPDYTVMSGPDMLATCRDDAAKWAAAFCQHAKKIGHNDIDEGWMTGWFANAIESSHSLRTSRKRTLGDAVRAARGGDAPPPPFRGFA